MKKFCFSLLGNLLVLSYAQAGSDFNIDEARQVLAGKTSVQGRHREVDVSTMDPEGALKMSSTGLKVGVPGFLKDKVREYTKNQHIISTAQYMAAVFDKGNVHYPTKHDLMRKNLKQNVVQVYDLLLNHFMWEKGHTTAVDNEEVAAYLVLRARLQKMQNKWK